MLPTLNKRNIRYVGQSKDEDVSSVLIEASAQQQERRVSLRNIDVEWDDSKTQLREATEEDIVVLRQEEAAANGPVVPEKVGEHMDTLPSLAARHGKGVR